jgi:hypothetical protein
LSESWDSRREQEELGRKDSGGIPGSQEAQSRKEPRERKRPSVGARQGLSAQTVLRCQGPCSRESREAPSKHSRLGHQWWQSEIKHAFTFSSKPFWVALGRERKRIEWECYVDLVRLSNM